MKIDEIVQKATVSVIAEEVIRRLFALKKEVLVVFTGSLINFDYSLETLERLKNQGYEFRVCLTESAYTLLDVSRIKEILKPEVLYRERDELPEKLAQEFDRIIVPAMTINTAAKLASCIADTMVTRLILSAMMRRKQVIISVDGCCPDHEIRRQKGYLIPQAMKEKLRSNIEVLALYGATLTTSEQLYQAVTVEPQEEKHLPSTKILTQKVISISDINLNRKEKVLKVGRDALITHLAKEAAEKYNINIIRE